MRDLCHEAAFAVYVRDCSARIDGRCSAVLSSCAMDLFDPRRTAVVVNPRAGGGRVGREWKALETTLRARLGDCRFEYTARGGDGIELAEKVVREGCTTVLSLGGDGTHGEVLNGMLRAGAENDLSLGVLPVGTGGDFKRTLGVETLDEAARRIATGRSRPIDVGRAEFVGDGGASASRWFLNVASCGMSGLVDQMVNASSKRFGAVASFLGATLRALGEYEAPRVRLGVDGAAVGEWCVHLVAVCNGRYAGGGMLLAPRAELDDGLFDVVVIERVAAWRSVANVGRMYSGSLAELAWVHTFRGRSVRVDVISGGARVDVDGETPGVIPVEFTIEPRRVRLVG